MARPAKTIKKERVNLNIDANQKKQMQDNADANKQTLTDYILTCCLNPPKPKTDTHKLDMLELELKHAQENLANTQDNLAKAQQDLAELKAKYDLTFNAMLWHSLPWYRKMGKAPQLPNNAK